MKLPKNMQQQADRIALTGKGKLKAPKAKKPALTKNPRSRASHE